jgi:hypothetical protein
MKPAFVLLCYLAGNPAGTLHLANVNNCTYFKDRLANQTVKIGEETKRYDCYCKLVNVNKQMRLW